MIRIKPVDSTNPFLETLVYLTKKIVNEDSGLYYEVEYGGKTKYLNRNGMDFVLYTFMGKESHHERFSLDENYRVESIPLSHYIVTLNENSFWIMDKSNNSSSLRLSENPNGVDKNGYNGVLTYAQCNTKEKETFTMKFPYLYSKDNANKIFPITNRVPLVFKFKHKKHTKSYSLIKTDLGTLSYEIIAINEYGLSEYLKKGSYALERKDTLERYLRAYGKYSEYTPLVGNIYKLEDLFEKAKAKGYNTSIPEELITFYNDFDMNSISEYFAIANAFKEIDNKVKPAMLEKKV